MTYLEGTIVDIIYRNEENLYTVLELDCEGNLLTCVGNLPLFNPGEFVRFYGTHTTHKSYGEQFKVSGAESRLPEKEETIKMFLAGGLIKGVGQVLAARIVDEFGKDTFEVIEQDPERLSKLRGISRPLAHRIHEQFIELSFVRSTIMRLQNLGLTTKQAMKAYEIYGAAAGDIINENPYKLIEDVPGIGFEKADQLAYEMGLDHYTTARTRCGVQHVLSSALKDGHTCLPLGTLIKQSAQLLGHEESEIKEEINNMLFANIICQEMYKSTQAISLANVYTCETYCAHKLITLLKSTPPIAIKTQNIVQSMNGISISDEQESAIQNSLKNTVSIITGGPGTGKTTILNSLLEIFERNGLAVALAAPTGRAAKKMEQSTGRGAKTIHRLLEYGMGTPDDVDYTPYSRFARNEDNPLEADAVIIDETSMVDIFLLRDLLLAIKPGSRLVFVGDADQLPSVGAGNVLKDMISSELISVSKLTHIYRQQGNIAYSAHNINEGCSPDLYETGDFMFVSAPTHDAVLEQVQKYYLRCIQNGMDTQIICPIRKGKIGVYNLNLTMREMLNPRLLGKHEHQHNDVIFRAGDKIMQNSNNYNKEWRQGHIRGIGVFNGDIGEIVDIRPEDSSIIISFDVGRVCSYEFKELEQIDHAYAITVHKSQGSEFDCVILPLLYGSNPFLTRNLLYTAITRAKKQVVIIGQKNTVSYMVSNNRIARRFTGLNYELEKYESLSTILSGAPKDG